MKRMAAALLLILLLLPSCSQSGSQPADPPLTEQPLQIGAISLEISAPAGGGAEFLKTAQSFAAALQEAMTAEGIEVETLSLSFSRADAATAQALSEGGVALGVLGTMAGFAEEGLIPAALMSRSADAPSCGVIAAADSAYGAQLLSRAQSGSPISWTEWNRAVFGAVESDVLLLQAADFALTESTAHGVEELAAWRSFATEEELLNAMAQGEIDAALLRSERAEESAVLLKTDVLYEAVFAVSPAAEQLTAERVTAALRTALMKTAESPAGQEFLAQYGCSAWTAANEEEIKALQRLANWEDTK